MLDLKAEDFKSLGIKGSLVEPYIPYINKLFTEFEISTQNRFVYAIATILHETGGFKYLSEIKPDPRLKNYFGRGLIQLTWFRNYVNFQSFIKARGETYNVVARPELVADMPYLSVLSFCYYWQINNLNDFADKSYFVGLQAVVNAGRQTAGTINNIEQRLTTLMETKRWFTQL